jgi:hypothetical protein
MTAYEMEKDKAKDPRGLLCFIVESIRRSRYFVKYLYHASTIILETKIYSLQKIDNQMESEGEERRDRQELLHLRWVVPEQRV